MAVPIFVPQLGQEEAEEGYSCEHVEQAYKGILVINIKGLLLGRFIHLCIGTYKSPYHWRDFNAAHNNNKKTNLFPYYRWKDMRNTSFLP